jgi:uncharacterized protein YcfJ
MTKFYAILFLSLFSFNAWSGSYTYGRVMYVEPVYREIYYNQPRGQWVCDRYTRNYRGGDALLGAVIGGAIGRQFGDGDGRDAATVAGVLIGGSVGYNRGRRYGYSNENCYWVRDDYYGYQSRSTAYPDGYNVTYTINGRDRYTIHMGYDPGSTVRVRID